VTARTSIALLLLIAACATTRSPDPNGPIERRCDDGAALACHDLARRVEREDPALRDRLLSRACALGHVESCYDLAVHEAERGHLDVAVTHYTLACKGEHLPACYNLGTCLISGPCARDEIRGAALLEHACEGGEPHGCLNLGNSYLLGRGVEKQPDKAVRLLDRACRGGIGLACYNLGQVFAVGEGVAPDPERAANLFARACHDGVVEACGR
jgi:TPR repeat protein